MAFDPRRSGMSLGGIGTRTADQAVIDEGLRSYMLRVYNYMASGLLLSGVVAVLTFSTGFFTLLFDPAAGITGLGMVVMWSPLILLLIMSFGYAKLSPFALQGMYWAFCAIDGASLSYIFLLYTAESIVRVFFITAATFGAMSLWGYTTKKDLSGFGSFLFMGVIGLIIASIVNIFLQSSAMMWMISVLGVLIFTGLTAYQTQSIKAEYIEHRMTGGAATKTAVMGAVALYITFVNIFQFLLMLLGNRE